ELGNGIWVPAEPFEHRGQIAPGKPARDRGAVGLGNFPAYHDLQKPQKMALCEPLPHEILQKLAQRIHSFGPVVDKPQSEEPAYPNSRRLPSFSGYCPLPILPSLRR